MKNIKKVVAMVLCLSMVALCACGGSTIKTDYATAEEFEASLNNRDDTVGKTVTIIVEDVDTESAFGYNVYAGEHLNIISGKNPKVKSGDTMQFKVTEVSDFFGSWLIKYELIK